jgi:SAM-dependent methyltransferase
MHPQPLRSRIPAVACVLLLACAATAPRAQTPAGTYQPVPGQPGKDVVWIPSPEHSVEKMLDLARVTPQDYVIDLGSGDGRNVIAAARRGARAFGVEFNPDLVELSRRNAAAAGVSDRALFAQGDMFEADLSQATVLALFLLPAHLSRLGPAFLNLKPGTRIVSNTYEIGNGWEPDESLRAEPCLSWCILSLYVVPARAGGTWQLASGAYLYLTQAFQRVQGRFELDGLGVSIDNGRLRGEEIRFTVNRVEYTGRITGDTMKGMAAGRAPFAWSAVRVQP